MSTHLAIDAQPRTVIGKGSARATRREGFVPGIIYGDKKESVPLRLERRVLVKMLEDPAFFTQICDVSIDGTSHQVMAREVQTNPVNGLPIHIDFIRVSEASEIEVAVPVVFLNQDKSPGLKRGALLNIVRHEIDVIAKAGAIPDQLTADVTGLDVGDSIHFSHVAVPEGVRPVIEDRDFTIATIAAPSAMRGQAQAEGEEDAEAADEAEDGEGGED